MSLSSLCLVSIILPGIVGLPIEDQPTNAFVDDPVLDIMSSSSATSMDADTDTVDNQSGGGQTLSGACLPGRNAAYSYREWKARGCCGTVEHDDNGDVFCTGSAPQKTTAWKMQVARKRTAAQMNILYNNEDDMDTIRYASLDAAKTACATAARGVCSGIFKYPRAGGGGQYELRCTKPSTSTNDQPYCTKNLGWAADGHVYVKPAQTDEYSSECKACIKDCGQKLGSPQQCLTSNAFPCASLCSSSGPAISCKVSPFQSWGACSKMCGGGTQSRHRTVLTHPARGGTACPKLEERRTCNTAACPIQCKASAWSSWGVCATTNPSGCGAGTKGRTRSSSCARGQTPRGLLLKESHSCTAPCDSLAPTPVPTRPKLARPTLNPTHTGVEQTPKSTQVKDCSGTLYSTGADPNMKVIWSARPFKNSKIPFLKKITASVSRALDDEGDESNTGGLGSSITLEGSLNFGSTALRLMMRMYQLEANSVEDEAMGGIIAKLRRGEGGGLQATVDSIRENLKFDIRLALPSGFRVSTLFPALCDTFMDVGPISVSIWLSNEELEAEDVERLMPEVKSAGTVTFTLQPGISFLGMIDFTTVVRKTPLQAIMTNLNVFVWGTIPFNFLDGVYALGASIAVSFPSPMNKVLLAAAGEFGIEVAVGTSPSVEMYVKFSAKLNLKGKPIFSVRGSVKTGTAADVRILGEMASCWKNVYGVAGLSACDCAIGIGLGAPSLVTYLELRGKITLGGKGFDLGFVFDSAEPDKNAIWFKQIGKITFTDIVNMPLHMLRAAGFPAPIIPNILRISVENVLVSVAADVVEIDGTAYPAGVNAAFKLVIFGFMIEVSVLIDSGSCDGEQDGNDKLATSLVGCTPGANPGIEAHVAVSPLKFGSWFELTSADGSEGPSLDVVFDASVQEFAFTGRLKLGSLLHVQCEMEIALTKVMIKFDFTAAGGLFTMNFDLLAQVPTLGNPVADFHLKILYKNDFIAYLKNKITEGTAAASKEIDKAAGNANRALEAAAAKLRNCGSEELELELDSQALRALTAEMVEESVRRIRRKVMTAKELAAVDESAPMTIKELAVLYARAGFNGTASPFVDPSILEDFEADAVRERLQEESDDEGLETDLELFTESSVRSRASEKWGGGRRRRWHIHHRHIAKLISKAWKGVTKAASDAWKGATKFVAKAASATWKAVSHTASAMANGIKTAAKHIHKHVLVPAGNAIKAAADTFVKALCNLGAGLLDHVIGNIVNGFLKGVSFIVLHGGRFLAAIIGQPWHVEKFSYEGSLKGATQGNFGTAYLRFRVLGAVKVLNIVFDFKNPSRMIGSIVTSVMGLIIPGGNKVKTLPAASSYLAVVKSEEDKILSKREWVSLVTPSGRCMEEQSSKLIMATCSGKRNQLFWWGGTTKDRIMHFGAGTGSADRCVDIGVSEGAAIELKTCGGARQAWKFKASPRGTVLAVDGSDSVVVTIGSSSSSNIKAGIAVPAGRQCPAAVSKANWVGGFTHADRFEIKQSGTTLQARRTDSDDGWGMNLQIRCTQANGEVGCATESHGKLVRKPCSTSTTVFTAMPVDFTE